ncbi:ATP-binding domain-containing protein [Streptomyces sp. NPDC058662]|uniref:ATP-binding domain-containing protein n=1 Tax=Streptomyces sp. NPDC058662 TaxID=3346583 RepID=UPI0036643440
MSTDRRASDTAAAEPGEAGHEAPGAEPTAAAPGGPTAEPAPTGPGAAADDGPAPEPTTAPDTPAAESAAGPEAADAGSTDADGAQTVDAEAAGADGPDTAGPEGAGTADADGADDAETVDAEAAGVEEAEPDAAVGPAEGGRAAEAAPEAPALCVGGAYLAAQRIERERIARRKAERQAPVEAGAKLSGTAADLLAAVRAVESGAERAAVSFDEAPAAPRRPAAAPPPRPRTPAHAPPPEPALAPAPPAAALDAVRAVLARGGAPEALCGPAASALGEDAAERLAEDPWLLLSLPAVNPAQADGFARALLGSQAGPGDERRTAALVGWLLAVAGSKGHTALEAPVLWSALAQYAVPDPAGALEQAVGEGAVLVFHEPLGGPAEGGAGAAGPAPDAHDAGDPPEESEQRPVRVLVGLEGAAMAEESLADGLARLANAFDARADWEEAAGAAPNPSAAALIRAVAGHGLVTHTGGETARAEPLALAATAREQGLRVCLAAHAPAEGSVTTAGLLSGTEGPGRDADGQFALDLLVVLDAPQLDVETAAALVESVPDGARLVLSGDPGVLGSAGAGRVFADVLAARVCPQVVSRTPDPGPLGELVSGVGIGELNQVEAPGKEIVIVPVKDAGEAVHRCVQLVAESVPRAFGIPADSVQVVTPGHAGSAGTRALNAALKERLNPGPGRFGGFDPGDRVVHVPAPGRALPARVVSADAQGLHLDRAGARVVVPKELVEAQVRHGWAVTAHQAVGARWPAVVVVLPGDAAQALSRDWVYTAFGRAERHLSVVHGVDQALPHAVAEVPPKPRTTRLTGLLAALGAAAREQPEQPG